MSRPYGLSMSQLLLYRLCFSIDIFFLQIFIPILALLYSPKVGGKVQLFKWCVEWLGVRYNRIGTQGVHVPEDGSRVMYLCNHRSWGDFIIDRVLTSFQGCYLSRFMVILGLPLASGFAYMSGAVWFFHRAKKGTDRNALFSLMDRNLKINSDTGIIVYPEGHRNLAMKSLPLKTGCIQYAWDRKIHVQLIIAKGKEHILDEKHLVTRVNRDIRVAYSDPIIPENYTSYDDFLAAVQNCWRSYWGIVFGDTGDAPKDGSPKESAKGKAPVVESPAKAVRWHPPVLEAQVSSDRVPQIEKAHATAQLMLQALRFLILAVPFLLAATLV